MLIVCKSGKIAGVEVVVCGGGVKMAKYRSGGCGVVGVEPMQRTANCGSLVIL
jgi:hypothetical protein